MHGAIGTMELQDTTRPIMGIAREWYALLVASGMERKVCIWLRRRQYEPYWPRYKGQVKLNRHGRAVRWRSVIPGYLFLPAPQVGSVNWGLVESAPGVNGFMCSGANIVTLPENGRQGIEKILEIEAALNASVVAAEQGIPFRAGQVVWLKRLEIKAKIEKIDSRKQITLQDVPLFGGRISRMTVPASEIEAV